MFSVGASGANIKERYRLNRFPLAHKGMGEVWMAQDTLLDRPVIVKFVSATGMDTDSARRFRREALLTARLDHPGVPAVYDLGQHAGLPYVVLERIDGVTLRDLVAEHGPLPIEWVAAIGAQVSSVLLAARQIGLVHRDLKPSNVMLHPSGAVKVLDFGLAVLRDDDRYSRITQSGDSLGTVGYMAPEQIFGEPTGHHTDLYGLGATLYDLLTGRPPFDDPSTRTTVRNQMNAPPPRPSLLRAEIPSELDDLVYTLLAIDPRDRPDSAAEAYVALAPLAWDLPPLPGVLDDPAGAVRTYTAIVGRVPPQAGPAATPPAPPAKPDAEWAANQAEQSEAAGSFRAAARQWRQVAEQHARLHGDDHPLVFDARRRAALAHLPLGEPNRALRQLNVLLNDMIRVNGPEYAKVLDLRREIERLSTA
ncbi:serine/threonine-protein kinase [Micromonospora sp. NBC_01796]|uniref:serine/threonine-protein kinase n=1 Tax=Micromonospora sp. NBC_01796 TaxID=2975987 RepID=UPI002DDC3DDB|nr:serine/threonine-protein kinase [Micromonospora sp. NBC_01796]WSA83869.1 serine/threonine protein kinase [Micromonospora sp. NBC_01796]